MMLGEAVESFLDVGCAGKSQATRCHYAVMLRGFISGVGNKLLNELGEFEVMTWTANVLSSGQSPYTQADYLMGAKIFLKWLTRAGMLKKDLGRQIRMPRMPKGKKTGISEGDMRRILEEAKAHSQRDYALLLFLATTGCRRGGVAGLRWEDVDLERRRATVTEKGDKARVVFFSEETRDVIREWREVGLGNGLVFEMTARAISEMVRRYARRLGIEGKVSPHQWRHHFARSAVEAGLDITQVSQLLGHGDIRVTEKFYLQFNVDRLQAAYERAFRVST